MTAFVIYKRPLYAGRLNSKYEGQFLGSSVFSDRCTQGDRYIQGRYIQVRLYSLNCAVKILKRCDRSRDLRSNVLKLGKV